MRKLLLFIALLPALAQGQAAPAPPYPGAPPAPPAAPDQEAASADDGVAVPPPASVPGAQPGTAPGAQTSAARAQQVRPGAGPAENGASRRAAARARRAQPDPEDAPPGAPAAPAQAAAPQPGGRQPAQPVAQQAQPGAAGGSARSDGRCTPLQGKFLLAFNKADIVDVLEQASRWTCRNFAYTEDIARGKITLLSKTPVSADEAYAAFLAALTSNNISVYATGRYYKLVRIADAKKTPIPTYLDDGSEAPALEQPVTKLFRLRYADPDQLRGIMGNFTSPQGADIQSIPPDVLIITDLGLNVRRIERLLEALDRPGSGELIRLIQVKYASARDLADKVNQIFQAQPAQAGKPGRRPIIGGVAPGAPSAPGAAAPAPAPGADEGGALSISKVLADERTNKLVVIADDKSFQRIKDLVDQLDLPTAGEGQIHVVFMRNAAAEDLAQTLAALAQGQASTRRPGGGAAPGGPATPQFQPVQAPAGAGGAPGVTTAALFAGEVKVTADKVSNALIVLASGSDFATIQRLVDKLDRPRRQVFVEAVILEVNLQDEKQFGVSAHAAVPYKTSDGTGYIPIGSETGRVSSFNPSSLVQLGGFLTGLVGPTSAQLSTVLPGVPSISVLVQALQTSSDVNVISTPHILASDNEDAEITVGQNVPFQAGFSTGLTNLTGLAGAAGTSAATTSSLLTGLSSIAPIQRQNVELRLRIKPQITEGDNVRLQIDEQTEEIASKDPTLGPTTAKRTVKTNISVKDQGTIVIGGLIQERTIQAVHKTPILGDIPVLGWLFRDNVTTKTKTNLLLFLTPYIIRDQADYQRIYERKRREQQEFLEAFYGTSSRYEPFIEYERKAGPYTKLRKDVESETLKLENGGPGAPGEGSTTPGGRGRPPGDGGRAVPPSAPGGETPPAAPPVTPPVTPPPVPPAGPSGRGAGLDLAPPQAA
ncbi:MAG TPA: type II secretion system secretin GspD [Anaeromyxobacteraceae bacterium]|nr:type II secretion system secretin GspD [Anaeromyxobacteraceae bacterium]